MWGSTASILPFIFRAWARSFTNLRHDGGLAILRKSAFVSEHAEAVSTPFHTDDSLKAAVNLKP
jgi:hypothetical protein